MNKIYSGVIALNLLILPCFPATAKVPSIITQTIQPTTAEEYFYRGLGFFNQNNYPKAIADLNKALQMKLSDPNDIVTLYQVRGDAYFLIDDYQQAIRDYTNALQYQQLALTYFNRGRAYYFLDQNQKALQDFDNAIALNNSDPDYYYFRGSIYYLLDNPQKAIADLNIAMKSNDSNTIVYHNKEYVYYYRGSSYFEIEQYEKALADLNQAISMEQSDPRFFYLRALANWALNKNQNALKDAQTALNIYKQSRNQEAVRNLQMLIGEIRADM
ncbi:tetratricopeptide repeat protein [Cyanobacterium aponinum AL20118]|uniref:Tetratricopeptide repeat protein n=1 Tax=Cyanobacterium aponinum AL20115 TaxID=3090662 RepID=A0AAF0Z8F2_9CHRO|nr:tetratricopeptide repeat protein [Cyanobacterium aponinum]PHV63746.1 hypothetical protein CSQ80_04025 [Cyanobacterium aponinum IPPAS B-1201]WPF87366.1 tetratricopeptide repeat protein [Cyanobacterium aponinum AL20115]